ncbi:MAG: hypothetical protein AABX65_00320 [Nanoarchaeota archaeon]|mgnify:CR=1 FL=1
MIFSKQNIRHLCFECNEAIVNPLCPECLAKEITVWMRKEQIVERNFLTKKIKNLLSHMDQTDSAECIICKKNNAFLCPYCFTSQVYELLKEMREDKNILGEFLMIFNFDFTHNGYTKDMEELGLL